MSQKSELGVIGKECLLISDFLVTFSQDSTTRVSNVGDGMATINNLLLWKNKRQEEVVTKESQLSA